MIADINIVRVGIDWQLFLMRPHYLPSTPSPPPLAPLPPTNAAPSRSGIPAPVPALVRAGANVVVPGARGQRDHYHRPGKWKRTLAWSMAEVFEAETQTEMMCRERYDFIRVRVRGCSIGVVTFPLIPTLPL
jgi:hypothetical protein